MAVGMVIAADRISVSVSTDVPKHINVDMNIEQSAYEQFKVRIEK
jgi:hypothetical protein